MRVVLRGYLLRWRGGVKETMSARKEGVRNPEVVLEEEAVVESPALLAPWGERYPELDRLVLLLRKKGKKGAAQEVVRGAARRRREAGVEEPYASRQVAIRKLYPVVEVRSVKKAGQNVQRPVARTEERQLGSALRLLRRVVGGSGVSRDRAGGRSAVDRLAQARLDTLKGKGAAWEKRLVQHRTAVGAIGSLRVQR